MNLHSIINNDVCNKRNFEIRREIIRFWRLTTKNQEHSFLLVTQFLETNWFGYWFGCLLNVFFFLILIKYRIRLSQPTGFNLLINFATIASLS